MRSGAPEQVIERESIAIPRNEENEENERKARDDVLVDEAESRGYNFDRSKLPAFDAAPRIEVSDGQLRYEWQHLLAKLRDRDPERYRRCANITVPLPHPFFVVVPGSVAAWEKVRG
jgi:hypothetical protein